MCSASANGVIEVGDVHNDWDIHCCIDHLVGRFFSGFACPAADRTVDGKLCRAGLRLRPTGLRHAIFNHAGSAAEVPPGQ